jgi:sugar phosphate isomerase/epimerase
MSERLLALASGVHDGNPPEITPADMVRVAADAGYNSVGLWVAPGDNWHHNTAGEVAAALQETGLVAIDVEVIWLQPGGKPDPLHHQIIALGGEVGAKNCLIVSSESDREVTKHLYEDLCIHAERAGMRACLEYMAITEVKTLDDALDVVNAVDHPAGGILVDPFHHERVGHEPEKIREIPERWLSYAQLCDMPERGVITDADAYFADAIDGRLAPGEGSVPVAAMTKALPADLPISLEIRSRSYRKRYPDHVERARVILDRTRAFLADLYADMDAD